MSVPEWDELREQYPDATEAEIWDMRADMLSGGALNCDPRKPTSEGYEDWYRRNIERDVELKKIKREKEERVNRQVAEDMANQRGFSGLGERLGRFFGL